jgi:flagellar hook-basal body complex protein FliE
MVIIKSVLFLISRLMQFTVSSPPKILPSKDISLFQQKLASDTFLLLLLFQSFDKMFLLKESEILSIVSSHEMNSFLANSPIHLKKVQPENKAFPYFQRVLEEKFTLHLFSQTHEYKPPFFLISSGTSNCSSSNSSNSSSGESFLRRISFAELLNQYLSCVCQSSSAASENANQPEEQRGKKEKKSLITVVDEKNEQSSSEHPEKKNQFYQELVTMTQIELSK